MTFEDYEKNSHLQDTGVIKTFITLLDFDIEHFKCCFEAYE